MTRILALLNQIPIDKLLHFFVGFVMSAFLIPFFNYYGFLIICLIAGSKEVVYDHWMKKGNFELLDFFWTIAPGIVILIIKNL